MEMINDESEIIINDFLNNIGNAMIIQHFLSNIITNSLGNIVNNFLTNIENKIENNIVENEIIEYKTHPTATMIKESFENIGNGDHIGFKKQFFIKCCRNGSTISGCSRFFEVCKRGSEDYYNNDYFLNRFKKIKVKQNDVIEYKVHPIANMIKESFYSIEKANFQGFKKSYFIKCCQKGSSTFDVCRRFSEDYWNLNCFLHQYKSNEIQKQENKTRQDIIENKTKKKTKSKK